MGNAVKFLVLNSFLASFAPTMLVYSFPKLVSFFHLTNVLRLSYVQGAVFGENLKNKHCTAGGNGGHELRCPFTDCSIMNTEREEYIKFWRKQKKEILGNTEEGRPSVTKVAH